VISDEERRGKSHFIIIFLMTSCNDRASSCVERLIINLRGRFIYIKAERALNWTLGAVRPEEDIVSVNALY
jgi:hypothetical protein